MNHIHNLQAQVRTLRFKQETLLNGLTDLTAYLLSSKFHSGHELDGYVNIKDVLARIEAAKSEAL
jgi:hypothetical protein